MKIDVATKKRRIAAKAESDFKEAMPRFRTGDIYTIGTLCNSMSVLKEYFLSKFYKERRDHILAYINTVFDKHIVLVLSNGAKRYGYTRNYIVKFFRGEILHGDTDQRNEKRIALHSFTFETSPDWHYEFGITSSWIIGPNLRYEEGNKEGKDPFVQSVNVDGEDREVTFVESLIIHTAYEFWQSVTAQKPVWQRKTVIAFDPKDYADEWGREISNNIQEQMSYWKKSNSNNLSQQDAASGASA